MNKTQKSYKQIWAFCHAANNYMQELSEKENSNSETTKLEYALKRTFESVQPKTVEYTAKLKDLKLDHALEDENGKVSFTIDMKTGDRNYDYSKEGLKALDKATEDLFNSEVTVDVYYATSVPEDLSPVYKVLFNGFVLNMNDEVESATTESNTIEG